MSVCAATLLGEGLVPAGQLCAEVCDVAALRVRGQADGIRIGDQVAHQACARRDHVDQVLVVLAVGAGARGPDAGGVVALHRRDGAGLAAAGGVGADGHILRSRRPQLEACIVRADGDAEIIGLGGAGVEVIERAGELQRSGVAHRAVFGFQHEQCLLLQGCRHARHIGSATASTAPSPTNLKRCAISAGSAPSSAIARTICANTRAPGAARSCAVAEKYSLKTPPAASAPGH
jgi:hypothetical protein